jgi:hypothetical protein
LELAALAEENFEYSMQPKEVNLEFLNLIGEGYTDEIC